MVRGRSLVELAWNAPYALYSGCILCTENLGKPTTHARKEFNFTGHHYSFTRIDRQLR